MNTLYIYRLSYTKQFGILCDAKGDIIDKCLTTQTTTTYSTSRISDNILDMIVVTNCERTITCKIPEVIINVYDAYAYLLNVVDMANTIIWPYNEVMNIIGEDKMVEIIDKKFFPDVLAENTFSTKVRTKLVLLKPENYQDVVIQLIPFKDITKMFGHAIRLHAKGDITDQVFKTVVDSFFKKRYEYEKETRNARKIEVAFKCGNNDRTIYRDVANNRYYLGCYDGSLSETRKRIEEDYDKIAEAELYKSRLKHLTECSIFDFKIGTLDEDALDAEILFISFFTGSSLLGAFPEAYKACMTYYRMTLEQLITWSMYIQGVYGTSLAYEDRYVTSYLFQTEQSYEIFKKLLNEDTRDRSLECSKILLNSGKYYDFPQPIKDCAIEYLQNKINQEDE